MENNIVNLSEKGYGGNAEGPMDDSVIITTMTIGSGGHGGYANTVIDTSERMIAMSGPYTQRSWMGDSDIYPANDPFWTRNNDRPRPWRFEDCYFVDANGLKLDLSYEEVDRELERLYNDETNEKYRKTLGYNVRKFLGLRIPKFHNRFGWY